MCSRIPQQAKRSTWQGRAALERLEGRRLLSTYTLTDLGALGLPPTVGDINDSGQLAGVVDGHAFRWEQNGAATELGNLGGPVAAVADINNLGQVIGSCATAPGAAPVPFLWKDGAMTDLGLGAGAEVVAINDHGQIVGNANGRAFLWQGGIVTDLGELIPGGGAGAADINNAGQVVGSSYSGKSGAIGLPVYDAYIWQNGVMTDLGTPGYTISSYPAAVNAAGQFAGSTTVYVNTGYGAAVLSRSLYYDGAAPPTEVPASGLQSLAHDINDAGQVVGWMSGRAYLYEDGVVTDLNTLLAPGTHPVLTAAGAINNKGQIIGSMVNGHAFLLTPEAPLPPGTHMVDDGSAGFALTGARAVLGSQGYDGDSRRMAPSSRLLGSRRVVSSPRFRSTATWEFASLEPGDYRVSATWTPGSDRASNAPFTVSSGATPLITRSIDQRFAPDDHSADGAAWEDLGTVSLTGGSLTVRLTNQANGWVIADAIRIERVAAPTAAAIAPAAAIPFTPGQSRRSALALPLASAAGDLLVSE